MRLKFIKLYELISLCLEVFKIYFNFFINELDNEEDKMILCRVKLELLKKLNLFRNYKVKLIM